MITAAYIVFWISLVLVFYTFFGYGIILWILVKIKESVHGKVEYPVENEYPDVTLLIAAYNEEDIVDWKMQNCRGLHYPSDKLHIVWVTDGSTDTTVEKLKMYPENRVIHSDRRAGKTAALNHAMSEIETPFVIMTDANTQLNPECIYNIVRCFDNPLIGCVSGEKKVRVKGDSAAASEGIYWKYESILKDLDARFYSAVGAAGELIAIRQSLWQDLPEDTLFDDMILSMNIVRKGYRVAYCRFAYAIESPSENIREERKRKIRLSTGGFQAIERLHGILNPFKYGAVSFQFFSHKVMRWAVAPTMLILLLISNLFIVYRNSVSVQMASAFSDFYGILMILQIVFYICAAIGGIMERYGKKSPFRTPYYFVFTNMATYPGFWRYLHFSGNAAWEKAKRSSDSNP